MSHLSTVIAESGENIRSQELVFILVRDPIDKYIYTKATWRRKGLFGVRVPTGEEAITTTGGSVAEGSQAEQWSNSREFTAPSEQEVEEVNWKP